MGHKDVAFISGKPCSPTNRMRRLAWEDGLRQNGITPDDSLVIEGDWSMESGYKAAGELLKRQCAFTAILAGNDDMALGAIKALKEIGKLVPEDISVTGFDNSKIGDFFSRR